MLPIGMRSPIRRLFGIALILFLLAGCLTKPPDKPDAPPEEIPLATETLREFFQALHAEEYEAAAELYGGSYETLVYFNPDLDQADHITLWKRICTVNGFQCLRMGEVLTVERTDENSFTLTVQFLTDEGEVFVLGPCCGEDETTMPPVSEFPFRVAQEGTGAFKVLDLPVYVP